MIPSLLAFAGTDFEPHSAEVSPSGRTNRLIHGDLTVRKHYLLPAEMKWPPGGCLRLLSVGVLRQLVRMSIWVVTASLKGLASLQQSV